MIKKERWDGRSRIPTKQYKENYDRIFKKEKTLSEMLAEGFEKEQRDLGEEWAQKKKNNGTT
jgi:hypothetical protein|tara:strand:+ start:440 stop:625 length:186 start_codon:yes stop_codon:yes gene_type:complete